MRKTCGLCSRRKARRACPARGDTICTVCCGTKRLKEINCPSDCAYLQSAAAHPAAAVQRELKADVRIVAEEVRDMSPEQTAGLLLLQQLLGQLYAQAPGLDDNDVAEACRFLSDGYQNASRGIIYEPIPVGGAARSLCATVRKRLEAWQEHGLTLSDAAAAQVLDRLGAAARQTRNHRPGDDRAFLEMALRVSKENPFEVEGIDTEPSDEDIPRTGGIVLATGS